MGDLGRYLLEMRERKGTTLEEISQVTRIGTAHLAALEAEEFSELPAPVFIKGFLRSYCEALREAPDQALRLYVAASEESAPCRPMPARQPAPAPRWRSPLLAAAVLLVLLVAGLAAITLMARRGEGPPSTPTESSTALGSASEPAPARAVPTPPPTPAPAAVLAAAPAPVPAVSAPAPGGSAPGPPQRLVARTSEPTWLRVQMDGGEAAQELLPAGATREWTAERRFVLTIGNAGGVELELNGRPVPSLGPRGAVIRDLVLPREDAARPTS